MDKMERLRQTVLDYPMCDGACSVGIVTRERLDGGPPSTDLSYVLPEAKSAIVFAMPLDQSLIEPFLMKEDRLSHEQDNYRTNTMATGVAAGLADYLRQKGHPSVPVSANVVYRPDSLKMGLMLPDISLRYLAVRAGLGHFGLSGNVIMKKYGAAVIFAAVVSAAEFAPTAPLPEEMNYCDGCRMCLASCASGFMDAKEEDSVTLEGVDYTYSKRRSQFRCQFVCGGYSGLHKSGKWSSWSPGRFRVPEKDDNILPALITGFKAYSKWPEIEGGRYHIMMRKKLLITCGHCQLVCHPDKEERLKRHKILTESGVVVQNDDGRLEAVSPETANERIAAMSPELRALYEGQ